MKTDVMPSFVQMEEDELRQLTAEVKETLAREFELKAKPGKFSSADLWNIRRSAKTAYALRNRWS